MFLGNNNSNGQSDMFVVEAKMDGQNKHTQLVNDISNNVKKQEKNKKKTAMLTADDMYEPGFRIQNMDLCSSRTRLLILITSAAAPSHLLHRQAIRMTWMNRYGPSVSMAFLVGTPQMTETDPVSEILEAEEQALRISLNGIDISNNIDPKEKPKSTKNTNTLDFGWYRFMRDQKLYPREGLDTNVMEGLNKAEQAVQRMLIREHSRYGDLIQCRVRDTYTNLTLKSIAALEWIREYCPKARYFLKTDDDMFIDVNRLLRFIDKVETEAIKKNGFHIPIQTDEFSNVDRDTFESINVPDFDIELPATIWGRLAHGWRPIRQHNSKYYVSHTQYAGRVFPDFCTGPAYLMTRSAIGPLYNAALGKDFNIVDDENENDYKKNRNDNKKNITEYSNQTVDTMKNTVPYLKLEDVYLTGIVAERLTQRAVKQQAKEKDKISLDDTKRDFYQNNSGKKSATDHEYKQHQLNDSTKSKKSDIMIIKIRRIHDEQFANKKITGRALDRALCSNVNPGFSWFHWYWDNSEVMKNPKKKKTDFGVISVHMVKYFEQFDLWRRLMDGQIKCKP